MRDYYKYLLMKRSIFLLSICLSILLLGSCDTNKKNLIKRDDFVNLLVDIHYFDAVITDHTLINQFREIDSASVYSAVLDKYNTDQETFYYTLDWYSHHPKDFALVYDEVFGILNKRKEELNKLSKAFSGKDLNVIYNDAKYKKYKGDSIDYPDPYYIKLEGIKEYYFDIRLRMLENDASRSPYILISLLKDKSDTVDMKDIIKTPIVKSNFARNFQFTYSLEDSTYKYIKIEVPATIDRGAYKNKDLQISKIKVMTPPENKEEESKEKK